MLSLVGLLAVLHTATVAWQSLQARHFQEAGAATYVLEDAGNVISSACDALSRGDGVVESGALTVGPGLRAVLLPGRTLPVWEATPGAVRALGFAPVDVGARGVWLSDRLAATLGVQAGEEFAVLDESESGIRQLRVLDVFRYPDDGRDPRFAEGILFPAAVGIAPGDLCIATVWPDQRWALPLLNLTIKSSASGGVGAGDAQISQLNQSLGVTFDPGLPVGPWLSAAAIVAGFALPQVALRVRRLEFASALHAGVSKSTLGLILSAEWCLWVVPAAVAGLGGIVLVALDLNVDPPTAALVSGLRTLLCGVAASYVSVVVFALRMKESDFLALFKQR